MRTPALLALALAAVLAFACGSDEPSGPPNDQITGTWRATSWRYTATSGGATADLIATGSTATLVLDANGTGSLTRTPPGAAPIGMTFDWERDGQFISFIYMPGNDDNFAVTLGGGTLTLTLNGGTKGYDVDNDGVQEPCTWILQFSR